MNSPKRLTPQDIFILLGLTIILTLKPFYLRGEINLFELGLYLPGVNAILDGKIPFRDFFFLRGPFELYVPAFMMRVWGENVAVLSSYFYYGTLLVMLSCVLIASQILRTRLFFYLLIPVLVARTFPRVVFTYWGGLRYAWGLLSVFAVLRFLNGGRRSWMLAAGVLSSCAFFTSIEIGLCTLIGLVTPLILGLTIKDYKEQAKKGLLFYLFGFLIIAGPYLIYLAVVGALAPYSETVWTVVTQLYHVINTHQTSVMPKTASDIFRSMINPGSVNFKHLTPVYLYLLVGIYLGSRIRRRNLTAQDLKVVCLAAYGSILFFSSIRAVWASQFDMALQPEKILLFFLLEEIWLAFQQLKMAGCSSQPNCKNFFSEKIVVYGLVFFLVASSLGYAAQRISHRFFGAKNLVPLLDQETEKLTLKRVQGMTVPVRQAEEIQTLVKFVNQNTHPGEPILMFPELESYNFIVDRPSVGRFSVPFSWFKAEWHKEMVAALNNTRPEYAFVSKELPEHFAQVYFKNEKNKEFYDEVVQWIRDHYHLAGETQTLSIYKLNPS